MTIGCKKIDILTCPSHIGEGMNYLFTIKKRHFTLKSASLIFKTGSADDNFGDLVRIRVGSWATIFEVTLSFLSNRARNTNTATAVSNT
jgi:hypothetical protein